MKKQILIIGLIALGVGTGFAQKSNVNKAWAFTNGDPNSMKSAEIEEAELQIKAALENPETDGEAKTWFVAGKVALTKFDYETIKALKGKADDNDAKIGKAIVAAYDYFVHCDELDAKPNEKGKVKPKWREDIKPLMKTTIRPHLVQYGVYSYNKSDYKSAVNAFGKYLEIPTLPMMQGEGLEKDTMNATVREYYEVAQVNLANSYLQKNDTTGYYKAIKAAYDKNPESNIFLSYLIDYFNIIKKDSSKALEYVDKAIEKNPNVATYYRVKGQLLIRNNENEKAFEVYSKVVELDPNSKDGYVGQAYTFYEKGDRLKDEANEIKDVKTYNAKVEEVKAVYAKAIPYLEKIRSIDPQDADNLRVLRTIYYNIEGDKDNYKKISAELEALH